MKRRIKGIGIMFPPMQKIIAFQSGTFNMLDTNHADYKADPNGRDMMVK